MTQFELGFATKLAQAEKRGSVFNSIRSGLKSYLGHVSGGTARKAQKAFDDFLARSPVRTTTRSSHTLNWEDVPSAIRSSFIRNGGSYIDKGNIGFRKISPTQVVMEGANPIVGDRALDLLNAANSAAHTRDLARLGTAGGILATGSGAHALYGSDGDATKVAFPGANLAKSVAGKAKAGVKAVKDFGSTVSGSKATKAEDRAFRALREGSKNPFSYTHYTHIDDVPASVREAASKGKTFGNTTFKLAPHGQVEMSSAGGDSRKIKALLLRAAREEERRLASRTAVGGVATGVGGLAVGNALAEEKKAAIRTAITEKLAQAGLLPGSQNPLITGAPGATGATAKNPFSSYSHIPGEAGASASGAEGRVSSLISKLKKINPKLAALLAGISAVGVGTGYALNHKSQGASPSVPTESGTPMPGSTPDVNQLLGQAKDWIIQNKYPLLAGAAATAVAAPALSYMFGKRAQHATATAMQGMEAMASHPNSNVANTALHGLNEVGRTNGSLGARAGRLLSHLYAGPSVSAPRVNLPRSFTSTNTPNLRKIQGLGSGL